MKKKRIILGVIVLVVILIIVGRMVASKRGARTVSIEEGVPIKVIGVAKKDLKETLSYTGDIEAKERIEVYPRVNGKIIKKNVMEGDRIKKGQIIALIDRDEPGFKFEPAPIDSLLAGIVGRVYVDLGTRVTPQTPVALIVDMDQVKVKINVVERELPKIKIGQEAQIKVDAYPEETFVGKVWKISPVVDIESRTAPIEILISNPNHLLKPGMFASVRIIVKEYNQVPVIKRDTIVREDSGSYVFLIEDNKAHKRKIQLGLNQADMIEVTSGLTGGETIVITGQQGLRNGMSVEVIEKERLK